MERGGAVTALALLAAAAPAAPVPTESLRRQALALNAITGEDAELGKIFELLEDAQHTKPLLEEAAKMAKEKDQPFNINATLILARTAQLLRQTDEGVAFYKIYIDQASQLQAPRKSARAIPASSRPSTTAASTRKAKRRARNSWPSRANRRCNGSSRRCCGRWCSCWPRRARPTRPPS